jgi:hypothetical protein
VEEVGDDADAAPLDGGGHGVLVLVDEVLAGGVGHEQVGLGLHPRRHE